MLLPGPPTGVLDWDGPLLPIAPIVPATCVPWLFISGAGSVVVLIADHAENEYVDSSACSI
jgi:hypothetical protein